MNPKFSLLDKGRNRRLLDEEIAAEIEAKIPKGGGGLREMGSVRRGDRRMEMRRMRRGAREEGILVVEVAREWEGDKGGHIEEREGRKRG